MMKRNMLNIKKLLLFRSEDQVRNEQGYAHLLQIYQENYGERNLLAQYSNDYLLKQKQDFNITREHYYFLLYQNEIKV